MTDNIKIKISNWCAGKNGYVRIPFFIFFGYIFIQQLIDPTYRSVFSGLNLGIHEVGHLLLSPLPMLISILGGTTAQLLAPIYGMYNFKKQDDYFAMCLCLGWLSTNFYGIAIYAADARAMSLPLVSPFGGHVYHDWNYVLTHFKILESDIMIGNLFKSFGFVTMLTCLYFCGWMISLMISALKARA